MGHSYGFCWDHLTRYNSWKMILQVAPQRSCGMWIYLENHEILIEYPRNGWDPNSNHTFFWGGTKVLHWVIACNCKKLVFLRDFFFIGIPFWMVFNIVDRTNCKFSSHRYRATSACPGQTHCFWDDHFNSGRINSKPPLHMRYPQQQQLRYPLVMTNIAIENHHEINR